MENKKRYGSGKVSKVSSNPIAMFISTLVGLGIISLFIAAVFLANIVLWTEIFERI